MRRTKGGPAAQLGTGMLVSTACGTAVASVSAIGLVSIEHLVGGIWSALAIACGGAISLSLARCFGRLMTVVPSTAGLLAYLSRGLGKNRGLLITLPYLLLSLFLIGAEATLIGLIFHKISGLPALLGSLGFLVGTWALCRAGLSISMRTQAYATWILVAALSIMSLLLLAKSARLGSLSVHIFVPPPSVARFIAAVGQALFLFMGFEFITCQADLTTPTVMRRSLVVSSIVLLLFYATVSLGLACVTIPPLQGQALLIPQLVLAESTAGRLALLPVALLTLLSSYTSYNGALLALSRLTSALAAQRLLPRLLSQIDQRTLLPQRALLALLGFCLIATALVQRFNLLLPSILGAAPCAALAYAAVAFVRERAPFREAERSDFSRFAGSVLALLLVGLAIGVVLDSTVASILPSILLVLGSAYGLTLLMLVMPRMRDLFGKSRTVLLAKGGGHGS